MQIRERLVKTYLELWTLKKSRKRSYDPSAVEVLPIVLEAKQKLWEIFHASVISGVDATATLVNVVMADEQTQKGSDSSSRQST